MCGISGFYFHDPAHEGIAQWRLELLVDELLLGIEHRGMDATGVAAVTPSAELAIEKGDLPASSFIRWRKALPEKLQTVLLHTRFATQGSPMNLENNHPIHYEDILVVHNGHISNDDKIFKNEMLHRNAEVDSESIAALFQKYGIEKAHIPLGKLDGNFAVAVADLRQPNTLCLAKGFHSPLYYYKATEGLIWASTEQTIIDAAKHALSLNIERRDIDYLQLGNLLLIQNGEVEKLTFKPYEEKKYSYYRPAKSAFSTSMETLRERWARQDEEWQAEEAEWEAKREERETKTEEEKFASDPAHIAFWESEPHEMAYTIRSGNMIFLFKKCDGCDTKFQTTMLNVVGDSIFCSNCLEDLAEEEENPAVVHEVVIELVAEQYSTNPDFVDWLLFKSDDGDLEADGDTNLVSLYVQFSDSYDKIYKELTGEDMGAAQRLVDVAVEDTDDDLCGVIPFDQQWQMGLV